MASDFKHETNRKHRSTERLKISNDHTRVMRLIPKYLKIVISIVYTLCYNTLGMFEHKCLT